MDLTLGSARPRALGTTTLSSRLDLCSSAFVRLYNRCCTVQISAQCSSGARGYPERFFTLPIATASLHHESHVSNAILRPRTFVGSCSPTSGCRTRLPCSNGFVGGLGANVDGGGVPSSVDPGARHGWESKVEKFGEALSSAFPLWVGLACVLSLVWPNATGWIDQRFQIWGLTITMLGMGMTLTLDDFQGAFAMPKELLAGVVLQYTVMPTAGYVVSRLLQLPPHYAAGLILVACCPGGTASNIVTYLARGNVALSVLMTAASTFLAVVMTPVLTARLVGQYISVDTFSLFASTVQVVLLPVLGGALMNCIFSRAVRKISLIAPTVAVFIVAIICAGSVGRSAAAILASGGQVVLAVLTLHAAGFALGYMLSRLLGINESSSRTISIEVGMQNSVLGVVLAGQHFSNPLTAVPCAVSSVCHSLIGSTLARFWRLNPPEGNSTSKDGNKIELS